MIRCKTHPADRSAPTDGSENEVVVEIGNTASSLTTVATIQGGSAPSPTGQYLRAVNSVNGTTGFYVLTKWLTSAHGYNVGTNTDTAGLLYVTSGASPGAATVQTLQPGTDWRNVFIGNNTLYGGTGSSSVGAHDTVLDWVVWHVAHLVKRHCRSRLHEPDCHRSRRYLPIHNVRFELGTAQFFDQRFFGSGAERLQRHVHDWRQGHRWHYEVVFQRDPVGRRQFAGAIKFDCQYSESDGPCRERSTRTTPRRVNVYISGSNGIYAYIDKSGDPVTALASTGSFTQIATPQTANMAFYGMALAPSPAPPSPPQWITLSHGLSWTSSQNWSSTVAQTASAPSPICGPRAAEPSI